MNCDNYNNGTKSTTKGNDGRGARKRLFRNLLGVVGFFGCVIGTIHFFGLRRYVVPRAGAPGIRARRADFAKRLKRAQRQGDDNGVYDVSFDNEDDEPIIRRMLDASLHLVDIGIGDINELRKSSHSKSYGGLYGTFCQLDFDLHKNNPSEVAMFHNLVDKSESCNEHYRIDLKTIARAAREYGHQNKDDAPRVLDLGGVAFHESRCGSTLFANSMIGMDPVAHRVYSESPPPITAMKDICGDGYGRCSKHQAIKILHDVVYLMSRSSDPKETHVFFKIQSIGTRYADVFREAFPTVPWIFIYREPVQVMMSHFKHGKEYANCLRQRRNPPAILDEIARRRFPNEYEDASDFSAIEFCAAHLASLTETALANIRDSNGMGIPINYVDLPRILYETIIPHHFNIPMNQDAINKIIEISSQYSKGGAGATEWKDDTKQKEEMANDEMREAADFILAPSYHKLQSISKKSIAALTR